MCVVSHVSVPLAALPGDPYGIRLVGSDLAWEGRVEVSVNGVWGTVCSLDVGSEDANIMCRQLGYPRALSEQRVNLIMVGCTCG